MKVTKRKVRCPGCVSYQNTENGKAWIYKSKDPLEFQRVEFLLRGLGVELIEF